MLVLVVGDCHGFAGMASAAHLAVELKVGAVVLLGDVWDVDAKIFIAGPNGGNAVPPFHVVLGNHERWPVLAKNPDFHNNVTIHGDYETFSLGGRRFGVIGRIDDTPEARELMDVGVWLGEADKIFFERLDGQRVRDALGSCDVMLSHDAPWPFTLGYRPIPADPDYKGAWKVGDAEIVGSRYLTEVCRVVQPRYWFAAHMHLLDIRYIYETRVYNLPPIDPSFKQRGYALLDTESMAAEYHDL